MAKEKNAEPTYVVKQSFRDINDFSIKYEEGDLITDVTPERLQDLIDKGLVGEQ
jgi:hypothetical protein